MLHTGPGRFRIKHLAHQLHPLQGKALRIAEANDKKVFRAQAAFRRCDQYRLAQFTPEQIGFPNAIQQALQFFVRLQERAVQRVLRRRPKQADHLKVRSGIGRTLRQNLDRKRCAGNVDRRLRTGEARCEANDRNADS